MNIKLVAFLLVAFMFAGSVCAYVCPCCSDVKAEPEKQAEEAPAPVSCCQHKQKEEQKSKESEKDCNCDHSIAEQIHVDVAISNHVSVYQLRHYIVDSQEAIQVHVEQNICDASSNSPPLIRDLTISTTVLLI